VPAQEKLSPTEQYMAYVIGLGIVLIVVALFLIAVDTIDNDDITTSLLIVGIVITLLGIGGWLFLLRPWEKFDDLTTPQYTGHEPHHVEAKPAAPVAEAKPAAPAAEAAPKAPQADDLTLIDGIGPKSAAALNETGITTFAQVAAMTPADLEALLKEKRVRLVASTETWPQQAALAAKGDMDALKDLQARIKGGVLQDG